MKHWSTEQRRGCLRRPAQIGQRVQVICPEHWAYGQQGCIVEVEAGALPGTQRYVVRLAGARAICGPVQLREVSNAHP